MPDQRACNCAACRARTERDFSDIIGALMADGFRAYDLTVAANLVEACDGFGWTAADIEAEYQRMRGVTP